MRELRRVACDARVRHILASVSASLQQQLARFQASPDHSGVSARPAPDITYRHGLDICSWATVPEGPPRSYLERVEISIPLTFAAQVATYTYTLLHAPPPHPHPHPDTAGTRLVAALGHSQGMVAAAVAAAAGGSEAALCSWAEAAAAHLFWLGLRIAQAVAAGRARAEGATGPWSLGVAKVCVDKLEDLLRRCSPSLPSSSSLSPSLLSLSPSLLLLSLPRFPPSILY